MVGQVEEQTTNNATWEGEFMVRADFLTPSLGDKAAFSVEGNVKVGGLEYGPGREVEHATDQVLEMGPRRPNVWIMESIFQNKEEVRAVRS